MNCITIVHILFLYLVGAIPTGYLFSYGVHKIDITQHGSKNIGATNVARVLANKWYFFVIFFLDAGKAWCSLRIIEYVTTLFHLSFSTDYLMFISISLLIGNAYSCFLSYKGGKGVSTSVGILWYFSPPLVLWLVAFFIPTIFYMQVMGMSILTIITITTMWLMLTAPCDSLSLLCCFITLWAILRHTENIQAYFSRSPKKD